LNLLHDRDQKLSGSVSGKGRPAGAHLVEDDAERKQIGTLVEGLAQCLLRRHVRGRAQRGAKPIGQLMLIEVRSGCCEFLDRRNLSQAKIQNLGIPAFGDEDVCRFEVAVDDTVLMRSFERVGDVDGDGDHSLTR
jgi:hypothetical protein